MNRFAAVLLIIGCSTMLLIGCGKKKKTDEPLTGDPVDLLFISEPPGAIVYFDGDSIGVTRAEGEPTLRLNGVEWGEHRYRFTKKGYKTFAKDYMISNPASPKRITAELIELVGIEVVSEPAGATVYLGREEKGVTPLIIEDVEKGKSYDIVVTLAGYFGASGKVTGGDSFYAELVAEPTVQEIYVAIIDEVTSEFMSEPPFSVSHVRYTDKAVSYQAYVEVRFEAPATDEFTLTVQVNWKPKPTDITPDPYEREVESERYFVDKGASRFKLKFRNFDEGKTLILDRGTYIIYVKNGENLMAKTEFEVK